ncbi:MAG: hypothetical protein IJZ35_02175 [Clostridia bacterium]|nr:hypothetical protein [Clostridia bacterium]
MKISDRVIKKYGRSVSVCDSKGNVTQHTKCIIQPLRYKNKMYTQGTPTEIGLAQSGYYLMLAPSTLQLSNTDENGYIADSDMTYHLDRSEKVYFGDRVMYVWAILRERNTGDYPVYNHFI